MSLILRLAPWLIAAACVGVALYFRGELKACELSKAVEANKAQAMVAAAKERDEQFTKGLEDQLRPVVEAIREQGNATQLALAKVKSINVCGNSPAARAFDGLVQPATGQARPDTKGAARP